MLSRTNFDDINHFYKWLETMTGKSRDWVEEHCYDYWTELEKHDFSDEEEASLIEEIRNDYV